MAIVGLFQKLARHPIRTLVGLVGLMLIVTDSARRTVDKHPRAHHTWVLIVLLVVILYGVGAFAWVAFGRGRRRLVLDGANPEAVASLLLAIAVGPTMLGVGAALVGAPEWSLWATFGVSCALAAAWTTQQVYASSTT